MDCSLCLSTVNLPVLLECFECFTPYQYHCMSKHKFCFTCFLQLKLNINNCLFCRSKVIDYEKFRIDLDYIYNDTNQNNFQCKFCSQNFNNHIDLYKHIFVEKKCIYKCECNEFVTIENKHEHQTSCQKYIFCNFCKTNHLKKNCQRQLDEYYCENFPNKCLYCSDTISDDNHWTIECIYRKIECPSCKEIYPAHNIMEHYIEHLTKSKKKQNILNQILKDEEVTFLKCMKELPKLYFQVFKEEFHDNPL